MKKKKTTKTKPGLPCFDCGVDTSSNGIDEFYMVHKDVWKQANLPDFHILDILTLPLFSPDGQEHERLPGMFLCIGCLEQRIGRQLVRADFTNALIKHSPSCSERLQSRLAKEDNT